MKNEEEHADEKMLANDRAGRRRCCGVCCSYYERVVAVLLPICGLLNLSFASSIGWTWGIVVGFFGLLLGSAVMYRVYSAMIKSAIVHNRSHKAAMLVLVTTVADVVFPYMLTTAMIQAMPQGRYPQWPGLRKDGFPTACRPAARNCVRLGNDTDVYASDNLKAPVLGGSRVQVLDAEDLFQILDVDGSGSISLTEFIEGFSRVKGPRPRRPVCGVGWYCFDQLGQCSSWSGSC